MKSWKGSLGDSALCFEKACGLSRVVLLLVQFMNRQGNLFLHWKPVKVSNNPPPPPGQITSSIPFQYYFISSDTIHFKLSDQQAAAAAGPSMATYLSHNGPECYTRPKTKSNKKIIRNAVCHVCLAGEANVSAKQRALAVSLVPTYLFRR